MRAAVHAPPVWDTHTHLIGQRLAARDFWEIGHYFWFGLELKAAGYPFGARSGPDDPMARPEAERIEAFLRAYNATRNTSMSWVVRRIFGDLYGIGPTDADSVRRADEAVRATAAQEDWPRRVCERSSIRRIVVNEVKDAEFRGLAEVSCLVPRVEPFRHLSGPTTGDPPKPGRMKPAEREPARSWRRWR